MVKLVLYMDPLSAPSRAVIYLAKHIGVELEYRIVNLSKRETLKPEFIKLNPMHTVPTLVDGSEVIYDSHAICAYLVEKYTFNDDKLYPKDLVKRAMVNAILHFDSCDLFSPMRSMYVQVLYYDSHELCRTTIASIQQAWLSMERLLAKHAYLCGEHMTIADICCVATISAVDSNAPIEEKAYPKLLDWLKRMRAMPFYNDDGAEALKKRIVEKLAENRKAM
uniref:Uncharacterized protein n=1 Tax=Stomoxys calcitrans TaxID=35570 RepID=A0A1I8P2S9_STOCA